MTYYKKEWYNKKKKRKERAAREVVPVLLELISPETVVDVGCGDGTWLSVFEENGVTDYLGTDGDWIDQDLLQIPRENFHSVDLTMSTSFDRTYDLAVSLEVGEHLPPSAADTFLNTLTSLSSVVLFSAAVPHQEGTHHVNEQWQKYWAERFQSRGYAAVDTLRRRLWENDHVHDFYRQNFVLYIEENTLAQLDIPEEDVVQDLGQLSVVHPDLFERKMTRFKKARRLVPGAISLRDVLRGLPRLIYRTIKRRITSDGSWKQHKKSS